MIKRLWLIMSALILTSLGMSADIPFRLHRYDSFKATPVNEQSIVFYGNSITNMHEWWECFGNDQRIINRGNSGGYTQELIDNIESLIAGHPAKVFIGIGTNDLGTAGLNTPEYVESNIRTIINRFRTESPATEVYVQSILPSNVGLRTNQNAMATNKLLAQTCEELGVTFIDLFDAMLGINSGTISYDGLHLTAKGYKIWGDIIAPYVGVECSYPATFTEINSGLSGSLGMRSTAWSVQEVKPEDVLFVGDEMIHGGEWHELLNSADMKNRGTAWGYGGISLAQWKNTARAILGSNSQRQTAPRAIVFYIGVTDVNGSGTAEAFRKAYQGVIDAFRKYAPAETTELILLSQLPQHDATQNRNRVETMNQVIAELAESNANTRFVDIYTPLCVNGVADPKCLTNRYLYARGYNRVANLLQPLVGGTVMTPEEFESHYAMIEARAALGSVIESLHKYVQGDGPGQYSAAAFGNLNELLPRVQALLADPNPSIEDLTAMADEIGDQIDNLKTQINQPRAGSETDPIYITLMSRRNSRYAMDMSGRVESSDKATQPAAVWTLQERTDGTFDIINCATSNYLSPAAAYNSQLTTTRTKPATGWKFDWCNTPGYYIISNGTVQINQTGSAQSQKVYNWGGGTNRDDEGCQYIVAEVDEPSEPEPVEQPEAICTLLDITLDGSSPYRVDDAVARRFIDAESMSVALEFTPVSIPTAYGALVATSNTSADNYLSFTAKNANFIWHGVWANGLVGYYTRPNPMGAGVRCRVVISTDVPNGLTYTCPGNTPNFIATSALNTYGPMTFGTVPEADALTLGGVIIASNPNLYPVKGTIHSARFYDRVLTDEEINNLEWDNLSGIESVSEDAIMPEGVYDLMGRRLQPGDGLHRGLYIINGNKTLIR